MANKVFRKRRWRKRYSDEKKIVGRSRPVFKNVGLDPTASLDINTSIVWNYKYIIPTKKFSDERPKQIRDNRMRIKKKDKIFFDP